MKVLITGGSGLLGYRLNREVSSEHEILTLYNSNIGNCKEYNNRKVDICSYPELKQVMSEFSPDVVLHTAAIATVPDCINAGRAKVNEVNVKIPETLSNLCNDFGCKLIYYSTDLVYDGDQGSMLKEDARINPVSLYAESKYSGEEVVRANSNDFLILRTALMIGTAHPDRKNHFTEMIENFKNGNRVNLFTDQYRTPFTLAEAARLTNCILKSNSNNEVINFGGAERVSRFDVGVILCRIAGFDESLINAVKMADVNASNPVPDVSMNTDKLKAMGCTSKSLDEQISEELTEIS